MTEPDSVFGRVIGWFKQAAEWSAENLGEPAIASTIREDLGLAPGEEIPENKKGELKTFAAGLDPDQAGFEAADCCHVRAAVFRLLLR